MATAQKGSKSRVTEIPAGTPHLMNLKGHAVLAISQRDPQLMRIMTLMVGLDPRDTKSRSRVYANRLKELCPHMNPKAVEVDVIVRFKSQQSPRKKSQPTPKRRPR